MDISFARCTEDEARFTLNNATAAFANALRRAMIAEVPSLAIEDVRIYDNNSTIFDEILAHRLGLLPLKTDLSVMVPQDECSCGGVGCPGCTVSYTLSVEGPRMVYSRDLIPGDPRAAPACGNIPVVKLFQGQKVVLEATAVVGRGREHAKWQPSVACGYKEYPVITIGEQCDGCGMCIEECPRNVLEIQDGRAGVVDGQLEECSLCRLCERACLAGGIGTESAIQVSVDPTRFIFTLEGDGSMPVRDLIEYALRYVRQTSMDLVEILSEISGGIAHEERV